MEQNKEMKKIIIVNGSGKAISKELLDVLHKEFPEDVEIVAASNDYPIDRESRLIEELKKYDLLEGTPMNSHDLKRTQQPWKKSEQSHPVFKRR